MYLTDLSCVNSLTEGVKKIKTKNKVFHGSTRPIELR
jgi:hypothetical protein